MSVQLMQGDCLELMKDIPDGSVDMVLADLPFGTTCNSWDSVIPLDRLWEQYRRACKPNAAILIFGQPPFSAVLMMSNLKELRYEWIYQKTKVAGFLNANRAPLKVHESVFVFYEKPPIYNPQFWHSKPYKCSSKRTGKGCYRADSQNEFERTPTISADGRRFPIDVIKFNNADTKSEMRLHPAQKPVALLEYLIRTYTNEGETVLDNTMGSGSCGVACVNTGRSFIGMELDPGYFETAQKRIAEAEKAVIANA